MALLLVAAHGIAVLISLLIDMCLIPVRSTRQRTAGARLEEQVTKVPTTPRPTN